MGKHPAKLQNEKKLKEKDMLKDLFDHAPIGIIQTSLEGKILNVNPALARMMGYDSPEAYIAAVDYSFDKTYVFPKKREDLLKSVLKQNQVTHFENQFLRKDGTVITCNLNIRAARDENGKILYLEGFVEDITEQKKTGEALQASEKWYRSFFENTGAGTIIIEPDTTISKTNESFAKMLGYTKEEVEGKVKWTELIADPEDLKKMIQYHHLRRKHPREIPNEYEFRIFDKSGNKRNIFLRVDIIEETDQSVASLIDITSLKKAQRRLHESESRFSGIVKAFEGFIYICNRNFEISFLNESLKDLVGSDKIGRRCNEAIYRRKRICPWCTHARVFSGKSVKHEFKNSVNGRWYYSVDTPIFEAADRVVQKQSVIIDIHERKLSEISLKKRENLLKKENLRLRSMIKDRHGFGNIVGKSMAMQKVYEIILRAAASDANVIIYGESGTGKELVARAIHDLSERNGQPFVPVNCGAIAPGLMESEFFGHKKGAFTGAERDRGGFFDSANNGVLFLDELGEMPVNMQVKLLRVLEGHGYTPVGSSHVIRPNIRIIAATNRNLEKLIEDGRMREDFFYRVHVIPIYMPPLRERKEDIPLLARHFLQKHGDPKAIHVLGEPELKALMDHNWPGNVRELENTLNRLVSLNSLNFNDLHGQRVGASEKAGDDEVNLQIPLKDALRLFEKKYLTRLLSRHQWNRTRVAKLLNIERKTLYLKIKNLGIRP